MPAKGGPDGDVCGDDTSEVIARDPLEEVLSGTGDVRWFIMGFLRGLYVCIA